MIRGTEGLPGAPLSSRACCTCSLPPAQSYLWVFVPLSFFHTYLPQTRSTDSVLFPHLVL